MTHSLAQLRKIITARRQAEGFSQPSSQMLSAHLRKHAFMFGELGIDPNALKNVAQKRAAWNKIKARFHPPVGKLNTRDAHGYIHATHKHVGYAYPDSVLRQAQALTGGAKTKDECKEAGKELRKDHTTTAAVDLNECRWQRTKKVREARKKARSSPKPADGLLETARELVTPDREPEPDLELDTEPQRAPRQRAAPAARRKKPVPFDPVFGRVTDPLNITKPKSRKTKPRGQSASARPAATKEVSDKTLKRIVKLADERYGGNTRTAPLERTRFINRFLRHLQLGKTFEQAKKLALNPGALGSSARTSARFADTEAVAGRGKKKSP